MEAKLNAKNLEISRKVAVEICNLLRYKDVEKAKAILERVIKKKQPIPYKRYYTSIPHRKGNIATGRYPIKASGVILKLLDSTIKNAQNQGLLSSLYIYSIYANKGPKQFHPSRHRGRVMKRTHLTIILKEKTKEKKSVKQKQPKTEEAIKENK